jgi:hypothetical protein
LSGLRVRTCLSPELSDRIQRIFSCCGFRKDNKVNLSFAHRVCIVVLLSIVSIPLHELGHYTVYKIANIPVHATFQSVRPITPISGPVALLGLVAGPAFSLIAALACLLVVQHRPSFFWATAAFTNATIRLFPCAMDLLRVFQGTTPFSDEGDFALALSHSSIARSVVILCFFAVAAILTVLAAQQYRFQKYSTLKVLGIYLPSLAVGIGVLIVDELLHPSHQVPEPTSPVSARLDVAARRRGG